MDHVIGGKFKLGRKIGSGSFGELYLGMIILSFHGFLFYFVEYMSCFFVSIVASLIIVFVEGVNVQTGEEVAVKLVCVLFLRMCVCVLLWLSLLWV